MAMSSFLPKRSVGVGWSGEEMALKWGPVANIFEKALRTMTWTKKPAGWWGWWRLLKSETVLCCHRVHIFDLLCMSSQQTWVGEML